MHSTTVRDSAGLRPALAVTVWACRPALRASGQCTLSLSVVWVKLLLSKLKEHQPDLEAGSKEVRKALTALKAESEAAKETREQNNNTDPVGGSAGAG